MKTLNKTMNNEKRSDGPPSVPIHEIKNPIEIVIKPENEVASVSAETCNKKIKYESKDLSGTNPNTAQDNDEDDNTSNHSETVASECNDEETREEAKLESETSMLIDSSPSVYPDNEIITTESQNNDNEANTTTIDHNPIISSDEANSNSNISPETISREVLDAIHPLLANRRVRLTYMTPGEVLSLRDRIIAVQTRRGPFLFLSYTRQSANTNTSLEQSIREHHQPSQEDLNVQHIMSLFRRSPGMRRCRLKDRT